MPVYTYTTLDDPLATTTLGTEAFGINDSGQIVGRYYSNGFPPTSINTASSIAAAPILR